MKLYQEMLQKKDLTREEFLPVWNQFIYDLNSGEVRVASKGEDGEWQVNKWVKQFILLGFKFGQIIQFDDGSIDKDTLGDRVIGLHEQVRKVSITAISREGVHFGKGVTLMPPCYANIGAFVDEGSMIDSFALVGSCAQIGKKVHIGAHVTIGGVLEPVGAYPVIIEDNVFIGAGSQVTEGAIVKKGAIIAAGVTITGSTPVYDNVKGEIIKPNANGQVVIPEEAVVVSGTRSIKSCFGVELAIKTPIIIKYGGNIELEDLLRP